MENRKISIDRVHSITINDSDGSIDRDDRDDREGPQTHSGRSSPPSYHSTFTRERPMIRLGDLEMGPITDRPQIQEDDYGRGRVSQEESPATSRLSHYQKKDHLTVEIEDDGRDSGCQMEEDEQSSQGQQLFKSRRDEMNNRPPNFSIAAHTKKYIPRGSIKVAPKTPDPERWPSAFYFPEEESPVVVKDEELQELPRMRLSRNCLVMFALFVVSFCFIMGILTIDIVKYHTRRLETYTMDYPKDQPNFPGYANLPVESTIVDPFGNF